MYGRWHLRGTTVIEYVSKSRFNSLLDFGHVNLATKQTFHRSYGLAFAGDDPVVVAEVRIDIKSEAMGGDPTFDVNSDRGDLTLCGVDAGQALDPKGIYPVVCHHANEHILNVADVTMDILSVRRERDDGIPDDLTEAMIRNPSTTVCLKNLDAEIP